MRIFHRASLNLIVGSIVLAVALLFMPSSAAAEEQAELSPEKIAIIKTSCVNAQVNIQQIKYGDAANRVNRGQGYESLLTRLMTPMNSRATLNGFNSSAASLAGTTTRYQQLLSSFKRHYEAYDDALTAVLKIKCQDKPVDFYRRLSEARKQRVNLASDITSLSQIIEEYRLGVIKLRAEVQ